MSGFNSASDMILVEPEKPINHGEKAADGCSISTFGKGQHRHYVLLFLKKKANNALIASKVGFKVDCRTEKATPFTQ